MHAPERIGAHYVLTAAHVREFTPVSELQCACSQKRLSGLDVSYEERRACKMQALQARVMARSAIGDSAHPSKTPVDAWDENYKKYINACNADILRQNNIYNDETIKDWARIHGVNEDKLRRYYTYLLNCGKQLPPHLILTARCVREFIPVELLLAMDPHDTSKEVLDDDQDVDIEAVTPPVFYDTSGQTSSPLPDQEKRI